MNKYEKVDGKYRKPSIKPTSRVPLLLWLPLLLVAFSLLVAMSLQITIINDSAIPDIPVVRKSSWRVAAVGDIACEPDNVNFNDGLGLVDGCQQRAVGEMLERDNLDAVLLLGDIQYPIGRFEDFERSFVPFFRDIKATIYSTAGNHDYGSGNLDGYKKAYDQYMPNVVYQKEGKSYYDFKLGPWKLYALDSNCKYIGGCEEGSEQYQWLTSKVSADESVCSIGFWHHPLFTSGPHRADVDILDRKPFWDILEPAGADIILSGHDHSYERFAPKLADGTQSDHGSRQFVVGTGGLGLRKVAEPSAEGSEVFIDDQFGYLYLELFRGRYEWKFVSINGDTYDSGASSCH